MTGISTDEALRRLQGELLLDPRDPPQIETWPGWFGRMPFLPVRIDVRITGS